MAETDEGTGQGDETSDAEHWERDTLARLAAAGLAEQRRARRWGILFKSLVLLYLFIVLFAILNVGPLVEGTERAAGPHTAMVDVRGEISASSDANADRLIQGLRDAFDDAGTRGVILRINSPGGSPVQAGMVYDEIRRLRSEHPDIPVYAVATDICATGAYYIAAAADRIYANRASIVGSIGVRYSGFGFTGIMDKLGIQRRMITAGKHKAMLDPFLPQDPAGEKRIKDMVDRIHQQFIDAVKQGRGKRLDDADPDLFSGLVWTGKQAIDKGLVDDLATPSEVARKVIGAENIVDFTPRKDLWQRVSDRLGSSFAAALDTELLSNRLR